jgi:hypothetical protein
MRHFMLSLALLFVPIAASAGRALPGGPAIQVSVAAVGAFGSANPQVGVFSDGGFVVVWTVGNRQNSRLAMHARFFDRGANAQSGEFLLVNRPGDQDVGSLAIDADGTFLVSWTDRAPRGARAAPSNIFAARFSRQGRQLGRPVQLNTPSAYDRIDPVIAIDPRGGFAAAWSTFRQTQDGIIFMSALALRRFDRNGNPRSLEISFGGGFVAGLSVAPDGSLVVLAEQDENSSPVGLFRFAADDTSQATDDAEECGVDGALAMARDGSFVVACADNVVGGEDPINGGITIVRTVRFGADGSRLDANPTVVSRMDQVSVQPRLVTLPDGGYAVFWSIVPFPLPPSPLDGVYVRSFDAAGAPTTRLLRVTPPAPGAFSLVNSVAADARGDIVVVFGEILARPLTFVAATP